AGTPGHTSADRGGFSADPRPDPRTRRTLMPYLLDTNVVSDLVRNPQGRVAERIHEVGEAQVHTSIIVAAELRYGAAKRAYSRLAMQLDRVLGVLDVLPFEVPADTAYGQIRSSL